jgi:ribosomal protein S18 acetylase RimI-like enzyme
MEAIQHGSNAFALRSMGNQKMNSDLRIATVQDLTGVQAVVAASYAHYILRIGQLPGPMRDDYALLISKKFVYVLEHEGAIKGILVLIPEEGSLLLDNVAVVPGGQGLGLGRKMLEFAEKTARKLGLSSIRLYTHETMTENIALYSRIGYRETHRGEENGLRRVYMSKHLAEPE